MHMYIRFTFVGSNGVLVGNGVTVGAGVLVGNAVAVGSGADVVVGIEAIVSTIRVSGIGSATCSVAAQAVKINRNKAINNNRFIIEDEAFADFLSSKPIQTSIRTNPIV